MKWSFLVFIIVFIFSCKKDESFPIYEIEDSNYPTRYCVLNEERKLELLNSITTADPSCFKVDSFGFIEAKKYQCKLFFGDVSDPDLVLQFIKDFIVNNQHLTGVSDTAQLRIDHTSNSENNGEIGLRLIRFENQKFKGLEVYHTKMWTYVKKDGTIQFFGHWYPEIYISPDDKVSFDEAKNRLVGRKFRYSDWGGPKTWTISEIDFYENDTPVKVIFPFRHKDCIEMRVCWFIASKSIWNFLVDTTTGELIYKEQYIIF